MSKHNLTMDHLKGEEFYIYLAQSSAGNKSLAFILSVDAQGLDTADYEVLKESRSILRTNVLKHAIRKYNEI